MKKIKLLINTVSQRYPIYIGRNLTSNISSLIAQNSIKFEKCLLVVDKNVPKNIIFKIRK